MNSASKKGIFISVAAITALALSLGITDHTKNTGFHDGGIHAAAVTRDTTDKSKDLVPVAANIVATSAKATDSLRMQGSTAAQSH